MELKECYLELGGDYDGVLRRLRSEKLVEKFTLKFLDDASFQMLTDALKNQDIQEAFRAAHTIKGVCQNLGFTRLCESSTELTELLRAGDASGVEPLYEKVCKDYEITVGAIKKLSVN